MQPTTLTLHTAYQIGEVDPRIFGGFLEHMGRAVYQGVYDPKSAHADAEGFRKDVLAALEPLSMTVMRYPGGNFVSGYHWEDGVGPRERPPHRARARLADHRAKPVWHRRVHLAQPQDGLDADARGESRHREPRGSAELGGVLQRRDRHRVRRPALGQRESGAPRRHRSGVSATRWTVPGSSARCPPSSTRCAPSRRGS